MNKKTLVLLILALIVGGLVSAYFFSTSSKNPSKINEEQALQGVEIETDMKREVDGEHVVILTNEGFSPEKLVINKDETVVWKNESDKTAAVNSDPHPSHFKYPTLNQGTFAVGESLTAVFNEVGTFTYHNHLQPGYTGEIVVE